MTRFGGLGNLGGLGDIQKLAKQAQKIQEDAARFQEEQAAKRITGQAGGGMVTATVNGHGHLVELKINPVVADPQDVEMLEDLIITAVKEATATAKTEEEAQMSEITKGLGDMTLPPGLF